MSKRVVLVRHGQSSWNTKGWIQGRCDESVLTELGIAQAKACAAALQGVTFAQGFVSPLQRAQATAQIIWGERATPLHTLSNLQEIDLPLWEGLTPQEATERFPDLHQRYRTDPAHFEMQGKLPVAELWVEAQAAWQEILGHPGACLLVVAHNAINQALIATALGLGPAAYRRFIQSNGGITVLNFNDQGQVQLESLNQTAHLGLPLLSGSAPTRLLLVRHGETHWNREGRFQGQLDIPLNATGEAQSQKTVDLLKDLAIDKVFTSPLQRPRATAQALAEQKGLPLTVIPDLQEISHGTWEGKLQSEVEVEYPGLLAQWTQHPETVQMPEGENLQDIWLRTTRAWQAILQQAEGTTSLVVAHDAINKALLCQWVGLGAEAIWRFKQGNGAVTVLDYPEGITGPAVLRTVNYTAHLDGGIFDCTAAGAL